MNQSVPAKHPADSLTLWTNVLAALLGAMINASQAATAFAIALLGPDWPLRLVEVVAALNVLIRTALTSTPLSLNAPSRTGAAIKRLFQ